MRSKRLRLYKNHINSIGYWDIWFENNIIHIEHATTIGGSPVHHTEVVPEGKQSRNLHQQVRHRIKSRINKQLDKGYVKTLEEAHKPPTNNIDMLQPMLAHPLKRVRSIDWNNFYIQPKLDGHRCLITNNGDQIIAYTRQGKIIDTIEHITSAIDIPEGMTLDGELYIHGVPLQEIASYAKRKQDRTADLVYNVFDIISDEPFSDRIEHLNMLFSSFYSNYTLDSVELVPTAHRSEYVDFNLRNELTIAKDMGYEGLILRHGAKGYEAGRRSNSLVKIKAFDDSEFEVVDITPSKDGWGILHCITPEGRIFRVSAPGTIDNKAYIMRNKEDYIGKSITVEYSMLTKDKIPFHPVATNWRDDL